HHLERARYEELAHVRARDQLRQEGPDLVDLREPLEHRHEAVMLALRELQVYDVVVEIVFAATGRDRHELAAGRVDQDGPQRADLRRDVDARHGAESNAERGRRSRSRNAEGG